MRDGVNDYSYHFNAQDNTQKPPTRTSPGLQANPATALHENTKRKMSRGCHKRFFLVVIQRLPPPDMKIDCADSKDLETRALSAPQAWKNQPLEAVPPRLSLQGLTDSRRMLWQTLPVNSSPILRAAKHSALNLSCCTSTLQLTSMKTVCQLHVILV